MERLARLEEKVAALDGLDGRVRNIEVNVATLLERVAHLPSKGFIVFAVLASLGVIAALIAYQDQLQVLLHASPSP